MPTLSAMFRLIDSYSASVKKMLDTIITKMGFPVKQEAEPAVRADDVLSRLQQGEISAEEAIALLKK